MKKNMNRLPANLMTAGNLMCGFLAVITAFEGHPQLAAWLILFAAVLDAFDGKAARFFGGGSKFGIQFDSMADMVSFGVAPAALIYTVSFSELELAGLLVTLVPVLAVAIRLAKFNVNSDGGHHDFIGLASPVHACLLASFILMSYAQWGEILNANVLAGLVLTTSALMVSKLTLPGLPRFTLREPGYNFFKIACLLVCTGFVVINPATNAFPALAILVFTAFAVGTIKAMTGRGHDHEDDDLDSPELEDIAPERSNTWIYRRRSR